MQGIRVRDVIESAKKCYINSFTPVRFYKVDNDMFLDEQEEYICKDVYLDREGLLFKLSPIDTWIEHINTLNKEKYGTDYGLYSIVNTKNIIDAVDFYIWRNIWEAEFKKGNYLTEEENVNIVKSYLDRPVYVVLEGSVYDAKELCPVFATKNVYRERNERMRFFFHISHCKYCKYYRKKDNKKKRYADECVNVVSDNYGVIKKMQGCKDFKEGIKCI